MSFRKNTATVFVTGSGIGFFAPTAYAATACYTMLAPIGTFTPTGCYTLKDYLEGIFTTAIGIAGLLAVIMIVACGVKLTASGSAGARSEAKECIYNAIFGVLIAIGSWLLLNTINPQLLKNDAEITVMASSTGVSQNIAVDDPMPKQPSYPAGFYYRYQGADGKNKNSPVHNSNDACTAAMKGAQDAGKVITAGPDGSTIGCFNVPKSAAPVASGEDATRNLLCGNNSCVPNAKTPNNSTTNVYVNKPPCVPYTADFHLCAAGTGTNVGGLDPFTVQFIKDLASAGQCNCKVVITGGTENGHKSHGSSIPVFDLSRTEKLFGYIKSNSTVNNNPSFCNYKEGKVGPCFQKWLYKGYWFTDETGGSGDPHWHVCKDGTVAPPGKPVGLYIKACTKQ